MLFQILHALGWIALLYFAFIGAWDTIELCVNLYRGLHASKATKCAAANAAYAELLEIQNRVGPWALEREIYTIGDKIRILLMHS